MEREQLIKTVTAAQSGNKKAMNALFNEYYNSVYYFALKTVGDEQIARDVTQETFVEVIRTFGVLREPAAFVTWAKRIAYHQCARYFSKKEPEVDSFEELPEDIEDGAPFIPNEWKTRHDLKGVILAAVETLPEAQRSAILLHYFEQHSLREIAEIQGVNENTVKSRLNYGRAGIKKYLEQYQEENQVKLQGVAFLPLIGWALEGTREAAALSGAAAQQLAAGINAATGAGLSVGKAAVGLAGTLATKIVAVATAVVLVVGTPTVLMLVRENREPEPPASEQPAESDEPAPQPEQNDGTDYQSMLEGFVSTNLNTFDLLVGDITTTPAQVWVQANGTIWSSDESVISVHPQGKVTAMSEGDAYVVVLAPGGGLHQVFLYHVLTPAGNADLSNLPTIPGVDLEEEIRNFNPTALNTYELQVGGAHTPSAAVWADTGSCYTTDESVVSVASNGTVTANGNGTAYVVIKSGVGEMFQIYKYVVVG